jgi:succinate-semialdehyde dehydrogenase/glutarate-semialdehyde dehydrogenase
MPFATVNPASGQTEMTFDNHTAEEIEARLEMSDVAFKRFRKTSFAERARLVDQTADIFDDEAPRIARMVTTEMGKTLASAEAEVAKCAGALRWFAANAESLLADHEVNTPASRSFVHFQPIGAVLAIMPWNFPLWQVIRFAAPALMSGNVALLKHAPNVPQSAQFLEDVFARAGFPSGVFTNLFIETDDVTNVIKDSRVAAVTLTGSEMAGRSVAKEAGAALKKSVLELGGSDPFIVLESADLAATVKAAVNSRLLCNGQSCIAAKRFVVVEPIAEEFIDRFTEAMDAVTVGDPLDPATELGPIVSEAQRARLVAQIDDAREHGAHVHVRDRGFEGRGWYFAPRVLTGVSKTSRAAREELFGPVAVVERVADLDAAIEYSNATTFGLGSSIWSRDSAEINRCIDEIEAGQVFVNAMVASMPELPFGGIKQSGYGRELSEIGLKEFMNAKSVWIA